MKSTEVLTFLFLSCVCCTSGYKILGIFPFAAPSHYFLGNELMKGLARAGHEATILTVFEEKKPPNDNYKQIFMDGFYDQQMQLFGHLTNMSQTDNRQFFKNPLKAMFGFFEILHQITEQTLNHTKTQQLLQAKPKYDVVIVTQFNFEAVKAIAPYLGAHLVVFNNHGAGSWVNHLVGNPSLPSYAAELILGFTGQMDFKQRVINTMFSIMQYGYFQIFQYPRHSELVHKYLSKDIDIYKVVYNSSLVLLNSHISLTKSSALVPCMRDIGGFHVQPPKKLPEDLQKYLDDAKDGVIYFSMGSNVKSSTLPLEIRQALMKAFSKRKEKVLWKFEDDNMPGKPANVKIEKWLPQSDLLAHPNIKLFITHGGFLSTIETVYHGVPTVAIPVIADQMKNARQSESDGYTKVIELQQLTEELLSSTIEEVISNRKYRDNVKTRSKIFHDRQVKPMDDAVYWIEYIVKHNGANHLKVNYLNMPWYQYYLVDVFVVVFSVIFLVLFVIKKTVCFMLRKLCKKSDKMKVKKQ
ncbi:UDP-glucosyltransferase 2 [Diabrotica virgifera virgifera]|uniref:UDP-glucuronosyltransferase n=1 Tax=Diabrotica virgifera virgifera TaxID=50390 RepID=A0A6P7GWC9_DIAVI|nr:UDP-glucosyltransferase 2 [Diabrotica virgifera virgifera]